MGAPLKETRLSSASGVMGPGSAASTSQRLGALSCCSSCGVASNVRASKTLQQQPLLLLLLLPHALLVRSPITALLRKRFIRPRHWYSPRIGLPPLQVVLELRLQLSLLLLLLLLLSASEEV